MPCVVRWKELAKKKKEKQIPLKDDDKDILEKLQKNAQAATAKKASAKTDADKIKATAQLDEVKAAIKEVRLYGFVFLVIF